MPTHRPPEKSTASSAPERLLEILLMFETQEIISVTQLIERFGGSRSSTYRDLSFLKGRGFVEEDDSPGTFRLGPLIGRLASSPSQRNSLASIGNRFLHALADECGETVLLCRKVGDASALVIGIDSTQMLRVSAHAADRQPLHRGAFGKVLLAYQQAHVVEGVLKRSLAVPGTRPQAVEALRKELDHIRLHGCATSAGEIESGASSVAVPVFAHGDQLLASISIAGPTSRMTPQALEGWRPRLQRVAEEIGATWSASRQEAAA